MPKVTLAETQTALAQVAETHSQPLENSWGNL